MNDASGNRSVRNPQDLARQLVFREQAGDVEGMATLYERDAILDIGDGHVVRGRDAIQAFYADLVATGRRFELAAQREAIVNGDLALTSTRLSDGTVTAEVARRQADGTWLWAIDQPAIAPYP